MDTPVQVKAAIFLSWTVVVITTADRLRRISDASTFSTLEADLRFTTLCFAAVVGFFIFFAGRRYNWARVGLLVCTLGGWFLWFVWIFVFNASREYAWWEWLGYLIIMAIELATVVLLFFGRGALWYRQTSGS